MAQEPYLDLCVPVGDQLKATTCYMCACRCGIHVHLRDGAIRYIEGNRDHPVNRGRHLRQGLGRHHAAGFAGASCASRCCASGRAAPASSRRSSGRRRCSSPPTGCGRSASSDPKRLAFFTGRDQSQALTGLWAAQFGTPNYAAHGGFCSVNMAAAGMYTIGGSFWEFGEPDWERSRYLLLFGVAEDHDSNPIKLGLSKLKERGAKIVSINPVRTGYSAIADEWIGITPGTDGLFVLALVHELLRAGKIDLDYLARYTNAALAGDRRTGQRRRRPVRARRRRPAPGLPTTPPARWRGALDADARRRSRARFGSPTAAAAVPVFELLARRYLDPPLRARGGGRALRRSRRDHPRASPPSSRTHAFDDELVHRAALDRLGRPAAREDRRPARRHACDARHLGAFQRLPHLPRAASAADAARRDRCARRLALQGAVPAHRSAGAEARRQARADGTRASRWPACRSAIRTGRRTCWSRPTARRGASTRRSPGKRRLPSTA